MPVIRRIRSCVLGTVALATLGACAVRHPETQIEPARVARNAVWRVEEGDVLRVRIYREPELSGESVVGVGGTAYFAGIGRIQVAGLSPDSLQAELSARYARFLVDAAVDVTLQRDVVVYGQARTPGVYLVDPAMTVLGLLARAGGASGQGREPQLTLLKADGKQYSLPRDARLSTIDITRGDGIYVLEGSFFARNQQSLSAVTLAVTLISSIIGIIIFVSGR